jgi:arylsulfatase
VADPNAKLPRHILPIPDAKHVGLTTYDAKDPNTKYPPIVPLRPPVGAPNVLIVLLDDVGFGASSAFGGPCNTPTAERLAANGLKYNRFHTTALCSPTRQAMLTGRNHHSVGMGAITEMATSAPGNNSIQSKEKAPFPEILKLNGYPTAQFGKCPRGALLGGLAQFVGACVGRRGGREDAAEQLGNVFSRHRRRASDPSVLLRLDR